MSTLVTLGVVACGASPTGVGSVGSEEAGVRITHGDSSEDQHVDLLVPDAPSSLPTVVLLHGGFWRARFTAELMEPLAEDLAARGHVVANVEYRRVGAGGGHPQTLLDVARAIDLLADGDRVPDAVDPDRVVVVGHSAGGQLAVWAAGRGRLADGAPGADPVVTPCAAVSLAGVLDLGAAAAAGIGGDAVEAFLGVDPLTAPERLEATSPQAMLPLDVPVLVVHGTDDDVVPPWQSTDYAGQATAAGAVVEQVMGEGDHFDVIDPAHELWRTTAERLPTLCDGQP